MGYLRPLQPWNRTGTIARFGRLVYYEPAGLFWKNYTLIFCHVYFFNIQVRNLLSFQKFQCFLQSNLIYSLVYSNLSSIPLTFVKKKAVFIKRLTHFTGWFILGICLGWLEKYCYSKAAINFSRR